MKKNLLKKLIATVSLSLAVVLGASSVAFASSRWFHHTGGYHIWHTGETSKGAYWFRTNGETQGYKSHGFFNPWEHISTLTKARVYDKNGTLIRNDENWSKESGGPSFACAEYSGEDAKSCHGRTYYDF